MLEEDDALAAEATSEEDEDGARLESLAVACRTDGLTRLGVTGSVYGALKLRGGRVGISLPPE